MKIFIAGGSGAIGAPITEKLIEEKHEVFGLTRAHKSADKFLHLGVTPVTLDIFDKEKVEETLIAIKPDVVIDMLTALPKVYTQKAMADAAEKNDELRRVGGKNLLDAAGKAGVQKLMIQSTAFWYEEGAGLADEKTPFALNATPGIAAGSLLYQELEKRLFSSKKLEGVALRFGFFYGPGTWYAKNGNVAERVQKQEMFVAGRGEGVWNFVHVEDAVAAVTAALKAPPGAYNITGSDPVPLQEWLPAYAEFIGAEKPLFSSEEEEREKNGEDALYYATKLRGASNAKAIKLLGFKPRPLPWLSPK